MKISSSFLSIKDNLKENINKLTNTNIDYLHLDIMDGIFVKNKTNDNLILNSVNLNKPWDVHLMVENVFMYVDIFKKFKPEYITFHYETNCDIMEVVNYIKKFNIKVGLAIKPSTKIEEIMPYLPYIDLVLVMSVEPGMGGQKFILDTIAKIKKLKELKGNFVIEVDGGINDETIKYVKDVDIAVIGSYITNGDYQERINNIKEKIYG